ncbi:hypothetical protein ACJX0J_028548 [Zea mays]
MHAILNFGNRVCYVIMLFSPFFFYLSRFSFKNKLADDEYSDVFQKLDAGDKNFMLYARGSTFFLIYIHVLYMYIATISIHYIRRTCLNDIAIRTCTFLFLGLGQKRD